MALNSAANRDAGYVSARTSETWHNPSANRVSDVQKDDQPERGALVCIALRVGDCADDVKQAIANKIIFLAKTGERNPDVLCEQVLKDIRRQPDILSGAYASPEHGPTAVASS